MVSGSVSQSPRAARSSHCESPPRFIHVMTSSPVCAKQRELMSKMTTPTASAHRTSHITAVLRHRDVTSLPRHVVPCLLMMSWSRPLIAAAMLLPNERPPTHQQNVFVIHRDSFHLQLQIDIKSFYCTKREISASLCRSCTFKPVCVDLYGILNLAPSPSDSITLHCATNSYLLSAPQNYLFYLLTCTIANETGG